MSLDGSIRDEFVHELIDGSVRLAFSGVLWTSDIAGMREGGVVGSRQCKVPRFGARGGRPWGTGREKPREKRPALKVNVVVFDEGIETWS